MSPGTTPKPMWVLSWALRWTICYASNTYKHTYDELSFSGHIRPVVAMEEVIPTIPLIGYHALWVVHSRRFFEEFSASYGIRIWFVFWCDVNKPSMSYWGLDNLFNIYHVTDKSLSYFQMCLGKLSCWWKLSWCVYVAGVDEELRHQQLYWC